MQGNSSPSATRYEIEKKQDKLVFDSTPRSESNNPVTSDGIYTAISTKPGEITTGRNFSIDGEWVAAGINAERFNLYGYNSNIAVGDYSHAEGLHTTATGEASHAEGYYTTATYYSHAEGNYTTASGASCHAEGGHTIASAIGSHAEGIKTTASNLASHAGGKWNKAMTDGASETNTVGDVFVIGNGIRNHPDSLSNAFRVTYAGETYGLSAFNSSGADYAEYFEWLDGNVANEDRVGYFVTLLGEKIVKAKAGDYILGVVSGQPCIIGNADEDWLHRWEHDEFGRFLKEDTYKLKKDETGQPIENEYERDEQGNLIVDGWRYKQNPEYDSTQTYIERKDRKEWSAVGMLGVLAVRDDGSCIVNGYAQVTDQGTATKAEVPAANTYRVIKRVSDNVVQVVFR